MDALGKSILARDEQLLGEDESIPVELVTANAVLENAPVLGKQFGGGVAEERPPVDALIPSECLSF